MPPSCCHFNGVVCSNPLFSNTFVLTNSLSCRACSTYSKVLEHLVWSSTSGFQFWGPLARTNFLLALCGLPKFLVLSLCEDFLFCGCFSPFFSRDFWGSVGSFVALSRRFWIEHRAIRQSSDSNRAIPRSLSALTRCDADGDSESIFRDSTFAEFLAIPGLRFWESCDSRFAIRCR